MKRCIPAARYHILTSLYDPFARLFFKKTYRKITSRIDAKENAEILDIGCGPGNLLIELHRKFPEARIIGLDIDPEILEIAKKKLDKRKLRIPLIRASATDIPLLNESSDVIVSSLMIHHLEREDRKKFVEEAYRVLRQNGKLYLHDFGPPKHWWGSSVAWVFHFIEDISDGTKGNYWKFLEASGFKNIKSGFKGELFELIEAEK